MREYDSILNIHEFEAKKRNLKMKTLDEKRVQRRRTERRQHKEDAKVLVPR